MERPIWANSTRFSPLHAYDPSRHNLSRPLKGE